MQSMLIHDRFQCARKQAKKIKSFYGLFGMRFKSCCSSLLYFKKLSIHLKSSSIKSIKPQLAIKKMIFLFQWIVFEGAYFICIFITLSMHKNLKNGLKYSFGLKQTEQLNSARSTPRFPSIQFTQNNQNNSAQPKSHHKTAQPKSFYPSTPKSIESKSVKSYHSLRQGKPTQAKNVKKIVVQQSTQKKSQIKTTSSKRGRSLLRFKHGEYQANKSQPKLLGTVALQHRDTLKIASSFFGAEPQNIDLRQTKKIQDKLQNRRFRPEKGQMKNMWQKGRPMLHLGRSITNDKLEIISQNLFVTDL